MKVPIDTPHNSEPRRPGKETKARSNGLQEEARATASEALDEARRWLETGHRHAAIDILEGYLEENPDHDDAMELLVQAHRGKEGTTTGKRPSPFTTPDEVEVEEVDGEPSQAEPSESCCEGTDEVTTTGREDAEGSVLEAARQEPESPRDPEGAPAVPDDAPAEQVPAELGRKETAAGFPQHPSISWQDSTLRGRPGGAPSLQGGLEEATTSTLAGLRGKRIHFALVAFAVLVAIVAYLLITRPWRPSSSPESRETITSTVEVESAPPKSDRGSTQDPLWNPDPDTASERSLEQTRNESDFVEGSPVPEALGKDEGVKPDPVEIADRRPGTLIVLASPWARVVSIHDENHDEVDFERPAFTPFRLELPPGWYSVALKRPESPVCTRSVQITSSAVTTTTCKFGELEPLDLLERIGS